ncbi:MAG: SRPBCC family protein [Verrucomicrobia bacterium]|nr:SRPBCC family protein [Verrucomicrobiota bacterium]
MPPLEFSRSCWLPAEPAAVYAFHADPRNIVHVSPPGQDARIVEGAGPAVAGALFEVEVTVLGYLPLAWQARWQDVEPPRLLCDTSSNALFRHWEHRHEFAPAPEGGTILTDRVRYALPGGWLGRLVGATLVRALFAGMFAYRHRRTQAWFRQTPSSA